MVSRGTTYPLRSDYVDALQNPGLALTDSDLRSAIIECDRFGSPRPISGAFASVFQGRGSDGRRWAIKCFCQHVPDQEQRYGAITDALQKLRHPALADFAYQPSGILVSGIRYPVLKMQWLDGQGLLPWLEINRFDAGRLRMVADQLLALIGDLESANVAHGDLQHGNLIVTTQDQLRLIDYDGMYVPALAGYRACEKGLANYQSPWRQDDHFQPGLDRFAAWIIYLSLIALAEAPHLWVQLHRDGDEKLLLEAADYRNPDGSSALAALRATGYPTLVALADTIYELSQTPIDAIPALAPIRTATSPSHPVPPQRSPNGLPNWLDPAAMAHGPGAPAVQAETPPDGSWLGEHLPPLSRHQFRGSTSAARQTLAICGVLLMIVGTVVVVAVPSAVAVAVLGIATLLAAYQTHPLSKQAHQARRELARVRKAHRAALRAHSSAVGARTALDKPFAARLDEFDRARSIAAEQLRRQVAAIEQQVQKRLADQAGELASISRSESTQRAERLRECGVTD